VRHRRRMGQTLRVVRLVVVIGKVVQDVPRVMGRGQALGMRVLSCQIVGHLGFICCWQVIQRSWGHIGLGCKAKHGVQTSMVFRSWSMVGWLWSMVSWLWSMVGWLRSMVGWLWSMVGWLRSMVGWLRSMVGRSRMI